MAERVRNEKAPIKPLEPRKRTEPIPNSPIAEVKVEAKVEPKVEEPTPEVVPKKVRAKVSDDKYIRYSITDNHTHHKSITDKVQKGEIRMAYGAVDGDEYYFYYLVLKK